MKKGKIQSKMEKGMTEYEKKRLSNIKLNVERMQAMGLGSVANKVLASKYDSSAKKFMAEGDMCLDEMDSDDTLSEDREYQLSENGEEEGEEMDLVQNPTVVIKGSKHQTISMVELAMARRNRKKSPPNQQQTITSEKEVGEEEIILMQNSAPPKECSRQQTMVELAMARKRKKSSPNQPEPVQKQWQNPQNYSVEKTIQRKRQLVQQTTQKQKKIQTEINGQQAPQPQVPHQKRVQGKNETSNGLHRSQIISPGSLALYNQMKQRKHQSNVGELLSVALSSSSLERIERADNLLDSIQYPSVEFPPAMINQNVTEHEENQDSTPKVANEKKHRGQTMMKKVHQRPFNERRVIVLNEDGQPIGPSYDAVVEFRNFLGTLAKTHQYAPLNILDWKYMPTKENIWSCVKEKYIIPEEGKDSVLESVNDLWRVYKSRMKKKHFKRYETDELRWANRPSTIPDPEFRELLDYWSSPVG